MSRFYWLCSVLSNSVKNRASPLLQDDCGPVWETEKYEKNFTWISYNDTYKTLTPQTSGALYKDKQTEASVCVFGQMF